MQRYKTEILGVGNMAQELRALADLSEGLGSVVSTHEDGSQPPRTPVPGFPMSSCDL